MQGLGGWKQELKDRKLFIAIFFIVVPIILVIFYELSKVPEWLKFLKFDPQHPTIYNMFLSSYTNETQYQLFSNLENYYILIFLIFIFETNRKRLDIEMAFLFLILPFVITIVYIVYNGNLGLGSSGINFGLNGYLLHCMYGYLKQNKNILIISIGNRSKIEFVKMALNIIVFAIALIISLQRFFDILSPDNVRAHSIGYSFGILTPFLVDFILAKYTNEN